MTQGPHHIPGRCTKYQNHATTQGRYQKRMHVFFRALPELAKPPPPPPPNSGNLVLFFRTSKRRFARMKEKSTGDDNDGCNDNYDGHFDDNDDKNDQKTYKYHDF